MKVKAGFTIKQRQGRSLVEPNQEEAVTFNKVIELDHSGKLLFEALMKGSNEEELTTLLMENYKISLEKAKKDVKIFIQILKLNKLIEE